jgi:two-component system chemotaxis sensor kinase CheA
MDDLLLKFRNKFVEDALKFLDGIEKSLLALEDNPADTDLIQEIFRVMHTLKGVSSMYGFARISEFTHNLESIYAYLRDERVMLTEQIADLTLKSIDHIKNLLDDDELNQPLNRTNHESLLEKIKQTEFLFKSEKPELSLSDRKEKIANTSLLKSFYIMLLPDSDFLNRSLNLIEIFKDLSRLGKFHIVKHQFSGFPGMEPGTENAWGVYLSTDAEINEIYDVFIFFEDNIKIIKIANKDIFDEENLKENTLFENTQEYNTIKQTDQLAEEEAIRKLKLATEEITEKTEDQEKKQQGIETIGYNPLTKAEEIINVIAPELFKQQEHPNVIGSNKQISSRISVDAGKLDQLMFLVSELVTTNAQLNLSNRQRNQILLSNAVEKIEKLSKQFRENALSLRLIPISEIMIRFQRLIRDLSHTLNKEIKFVIEGAETELDKSIIDNLVEPLMHIIRNSIDHGIEMPEKRVARGKPREGIIKLTAYYSGASVYIQIKDDGNGIDTEKVMNKAIEKEIISPDAKLTKKEIYDFLFLPGFSMAESLTQVSGRGVGMDVVRRKITEIRGDVFVDSEVGIGTTFTIKLQQTVSIIDTLLIKASETHFLLPLSEIEVCDQQEHNKIFQNQNKFIEFDHNLLPFIHLRSQFSLRGDPPEIEKIIIIKRNENRIAIIADTIIGENQAVLKPLGKLFKQQEFLMGASILGDGDMALMLDTSKLITAVFNS